MLNKPKHRENVIATNRGWEVERTGELLASHKNLKSYLESISEIEKEGSIIDKDSEIEIDVDEE